MKKKIRQTEQSDVKSTAPEPSSTPLPQYLLDRNNPQHAKALSSSIKDKRSEKVRDSRYTTSTQPADHERRRLNILFRYPK